MGQIALIPMEIKYHAGFLLSNPAGYRLIYCNLRSGG